MRLRTVVRTCLPLVAFAFLCAPFVTLDAQIARARVLFSRAGPGETRE